MVGDLVRALLKSPPYWMGSLKVLRPGEPCELGYSTPTGEFEEGVAYRVHPADPRYYLRLADFHPFLVEEKEAELAAVCAALGARSATIRHTRSKATTVEGKAALKLEAVPGAPEAGGGHEKRDESTLALSLSSVEPVRMPQLPSTLRWFAVEPAWQRMAEARLNDRVASWGLSFTYRRDYGVNAKHAAELSELGVSVGGSFHQMRAVERSLEIEFFTREDYEKAGITL
jgi:hypothetical protein